MFGEQHGHHHIALHFLRIERDGLFVGCFGLIDLAVISLCVAEQHGHQRPTGQVGLHFGLNRIQIGVGRVEREVVEQLFTGANIDARPQNRLTPQWPHPHGQSRVAGKLGVDIDRVGAMVAEQNQAMGEGEAVIEVFRMGGGNGRHFINDILALH